ncbi:MAG: glutamate--tRNA ligase [Candidatus Taylorbacteria bacterium]
MQIITRFAPSPTGYFHSGSYRTALFSCIFARQNEGKFILRIEDTDKLRSKKEYEENIMESLEWLGLKFDSLYKQSDRTEIYRKYIQRLIDSGHAYISKETPKESHAKDGADTIAPMRTEVIRFKNPNKKVAFDDMIRGRVEFDTTELGDFVIAKSMEEPVFHLVVVVDDIEMSVTHIIRGEDHISNTPRQMLIYEALGVTPPIYAHIPLLLGKDRSKLSKRKGAVPITEYRRKGYLPQALVNYLALLGWHPTDDKELFTFEELVQKFDLHRVQKGGAIFDEEKLAWFNKQYMLKLSDQEFADLASPFMPEWLSSGSDKSKRLVPILKEKITSFGDIGGLLSVTGELGFIKDISDYPAELLLWKKDPNPKTAAAHLKKALEIISEEKEFTTASIKVALWSYAETAGKGDVLWPLRVALTGQEKSPDPFVCAFLLGREETLKRMKNAIAKLS